MIIMKIYLILLLFKMEEVDTTQITHFAKFLKRAYIIRYLNSLYDEECIEEYILHDLEYTDDDFMNCSKIFFKKLYDKNKLYDNGSETLYTIDKRISEGNATQFDNNGLLYHTFKYNIVLQINVFSKNTLFDKYLYDVFEDEITHDVIRYIKKYIPSFPYIQYLTD